MQTTFNLSRSSIGKVSKLIDKINGIGQVVIKDITIDEFKPRIELIFPNVPDPSTLLSFGALINETENQI